MKNLSINYLRCYNIPSLKDMLQSDKQDEHLVKKVLQEKINRLNNITEILEYNQ